MSELEIYGHILSQPVRSVFAFCNLSKIVYTPHILDFMKGDHLTEEYSKINPNLQMPAIVHNGYNLWESGAIVAYLADAYNIDNQWYPKDPKIRGRINAYLHSHHQSTRVPLTSYIQAKVTGPKLFAAPELTAENEAIFIVKLNEFYSNFTWILSDTHYVARTSQPTIADVFAYYEFSNGKLLPLDLGAHPTIKAWFDEISAIPEVKELDDAALELIKAFNL